MIRSMRSRCSRLVVSTLLAFACACGPVLAGDEDDHEAARRAVEGGRALPLAEILERLQDRIGGEVVDVEFDRDDGLYVYELDVVSPDGRLREISVNAATAEILEIEDE